MYKDLLEFFFAQVCEADTGIAHLPCNVYFLNFCLVNGTLTAPQTFFTPHSTVIYLRVCFILFLFVLFVWFGYWLLLYQIVFKLPVLRILIIVCKFELLKCTCASAWANIATDFFNCVYTSMPTSKSDCFGSYRLCSRCMQRKKCWLWFNLPYSHSCVY